MSIRSIMLLTLGVALLVAIFSFGASSANSFHLQLVLAFAIPGGSMGFDFARSSKGIVIGSCGAACVGTVFVSGLFLLLGW